MAEPKSKQGAWIVVAALLVGGGVYALAKKRQSTPPPACAERVTKSRCPHPDHFLEAKEGVAICRCLKR